jgi:integrase/recombinase XerD
LAESGERLSARSVRASLQRKLEAAGIGEARRFSPHGLRRACATHNCEAGLDVLAMQQLLGHEHVGTTMAYVQPSDRYIERCYQQALQQRLSQLGLGRQEA